LIDFKPARDRELHAASLTALPGAREGPDRILLHGQVLSISSDSIVLDVPSDKSNDKSRSAANATSEPKGQELTYAARISLDRTQVQVEDKMVNLSPGMAVTAEIKTGSRRIISYLLSPLMKYRQESLRER
jgi:hemolysin D